MSIKSFTFVAVAFVSSVAFASVASAGSSFSIGDNRDAGTSLELGQVTSENSGVVSIYSYNDGQQGELLGTQSVHAGANNDVRVNVGNNTAYAVLAVLEVDGQAVASKDFDIVR